MKANYGPVLTSGIHPVCIALLWSEEAGISKIDKQQSTENGFFPDSNEK
jgi:hypothetical protein